MPYMMPGDRGLYVYTGEGFPRSRGAPGTVLPLRRDVGRRSPGAIVRSQTLVVRVVLGHQSLEGIGPHVRSPLW